MYGVRSSTGRNQDGNDVTSPEERQRRNEQRRERAGILAPPSIAAIVRCSFVFLLLGVATLWFVRFVKPYRTTHWEPYLRDAWVVAGGCLAFLLVMLVLRYRRIRADELTDTAAGEGARATRTRVDS
jgi:cytochrome c biogenesis protein CcdA